MMTPHSNNKSLTLHTYRNKYKLDDYRTQIRAKSEPSERYDVDVDDGF